MSSLGYCDQSGCQGDLCVSGNMVTCTVCGCPQPQHPLAVEMATNPPAQECKAFAVKAMDYAHTDRERLLALEKRVQEQGEAVRRQGEQLAALEDLIAGGKRGKGLRENFAAGAAAR